MEPRVGGLCKGNHMISRIFLLFSSVFALAYMGMHLYVYLKVRRAFGLRWPWAVLFALFSAAMMAGARMLWLVDFGDAVVLRKVLSYICYLWMAYLLILCTLFLALDILRLVLAIADRLFSVRAARLLASSRLRVLVALSGAFALCLYGAFEAQWYRTSRVELRTALLPAGVEHLRIAHLSDVHLGWLIQERQLDAMLDAVRAAEPHMLVITGDLVDGEMEAREAEVELFRSLNLPYGVYAVTGNHEYHAGIGQALAFFERSGIRVLRNEALEVGGITLAGVDDRSARRYGGAAAGGEEQLLASLSPHRFAVLLKHQPTVEPSSVGQFDLQLSGHTHRGQIWPFYWATRLVYDYRPGLRTVGAPNQGRTSRVYVSNGTGTWGPPVRFLARPEVVLVDIVRE